MLTKVKQMEKQTTNNDVAQNNVSKKHIPSRLCISCRCKKAKNDLLRIVQIDEKWQLDKLGKAQARGVYICKDKHCIESALKNKRLLKSYGQQFVDLVALIYSNDYKQ